MRHKGLARPGDDEQVLPFVQAGGLAQRHGMACGHFALAAPEFLVLHVNHGVAAGQRRVQQAVVVGGRGGGGDGQARYVRELRFQRLRVLRDRKSVV